MDLQRKTIQSLTIALDEKRDELSGFYRKFGEKLYADSLDSALHAGALPSDRLLAWSSLLSARENDTKNILDIKDAMTRQQELIRFKSEIEKTLAEENAVQTRQFESLGQVFFRQYDPDRDFVCFGDVHEKAEIEGKVLSQLETKQDLLRTELAEAGFFGKIFAQFRMAGLASNIRLHRARFNRILSDGGRTLFSSGEVTARIESGGAETVVTDLHGKIRETSGRIDEIKRRAETVEDDIASVRSLLASCAALENPHRRLEELRSRIKETDTRIDSLSFLSAREYCDKFLDEDGKSLLGDTGEGNTFSDMGVYAHQLEQVAQLRATISVIRKRIEILETTLKIDALDRNISSYERTVADYERKIQHFQELNASLSKNISDATAERLKLVAHKDEVEVILSRIPTEKSFRL
jgi:hypothetical protein